MASIAKLNRALRRNVPMWLAEKRGTLPAWHYTKEKSDQEKERLSMRELYLRKSREDTPRFP